MGRSESIDEGRNADSWIAGRRSIVEWLVLSTDGFTGFEEGVRAGGRLRREAPKAPKLGYGMSLRGAKIEDWIWG